LTSSFDKNGPVVSMNANLDVVPAKKLKTIQGKYKFLQFFPQMKPKKKCNYTIRFDAVQEATTSILLVTAR